MKLFKATASILLIISLILAGVPCAFAESVGSDEGLTQCESVYALKGDVNGDGRVTASDARLCLRASARLEEISDGQLSAADINENDKLEGSDARKILRSSANLEAMPVTSVKLGGDSSIAIGPIACEGEETVICETADTSVTHSIYTDESKSEKYILISSAAPGSSVLRIGKYSSSQINDDTFIVSHTVSAYVQPDPVELRLGEQYEIGGLFTSENGVWKLDDESSAYGVGVSEMRSDVDGNPDIFAQTFTLTALVPGEHEVTFVHRLDSGKMSDKFTIAVNVETPAAIAQTGVDCLVIELPSISGARWSAWLSPTVYEGCPAEVAENNGVCKVMIKAPWIPGEFTVCVNLYDNETNESLHEFSVPLTVLSETIELKVGEEYSFEGIYNVGWYSWTCTVTPEQGLSVTETPAPEEEPEPDEEPIVGEGTYIIFTFKAEQPGEYSAYFLFEDGAHVFGHEFTLRFVVSE